MKRILLFLKAIPSAIRLIRDPNRLDAVITLADCVIDPNQLGFFVEQLQKKAEFKQVLLDQPRIGKTDWRAFKNLPPDTLGYAYSVFLTENGLDPQSLPTRPADTSVQYVEAYYYETHDLFHVILGFNTRPSGELGVQAFYAAQMPSRHAILLLGLSFIQLLFYRIEELNERFHAIVRGWLLGKSSKLLFGIRWNDYWEMPLVKVRTEFGVRIDQMDSMIPSGHEEYFTVERRS